MAVDTQKLFYLLDPVFQIENLAGKPVVGGHIEVFVAGTDTKYITWQDWGGARNPFKIPLRSDGRAVILVEPQYTYDVYVYDSFNNMVCSRLNVSPAIGGDVSVSGLTQVFHDETISGNGTPQEPIGVISAGKVYEGIEPIVVNNTEDKISANHVPLGVQDPLYFVQDDEEGCIIGIDSSACGKTYSGISPILVDNTANTISITGDIGKDWTEEILSAANDASAAATAWTNSQGYLTGVDLSEYAKESFVISAIDSSTSGLLPTSAFATASGSFITALPADLATTGFVADVSADITAMIPTALTGDYLTKESADTLYAPTGNYLTGLPDDLATTGWVDSQGYLTAVDIPESAVWNATTQTVSANSAQWAGGTSNPQIPVTGINGIKISESGDKVVFEVSGDYATTTQLADKQDISGMTAYQPTITFGYDGSGAISSINETALAGTTYSAGSGIDITDDVISVDNTIARTADLPNIFIAVYNSTPFSALQEAYAAGKMILCKDSENSPRVFTTNRVSLYQGALSMIYFAGAINVSTTRIIDINTMIRQYYCSTGGWGISTVTAYSALQSDWNQTGATNIGYIKNKPDLTQYQTTAGMTAYQPVGDYYSASNPNGFVTSGELPTIGVQEGDTLDTDYDGLKIVKSTANGNEHINLHKKSTDQWLIHGNLVPTSPGSNKYLITDDSGAMHWDNKSALAYDSAFEQSGGCITAYNGSAFKAGDEFPQSATEAINVVTGGSANWNGTTETVSSNSGAWGGSALPISAGPGISLSIVDGVLVISTGGN